MIAPRASAALLTLGLVTGTSACGGSATGTASATPSVSPSASPTTNGIDTMSPYDAQVAARAAFLEAPTLRIKGDLGDGESVDFRTSSSGHGMGMLHLDGMRIDFLVIGQKVWYSGDRAFWTRMLKREKVPLALTGKYVGSTLKSKNSRDLRTMMTRTEFAEIWSTEGIPDGREQVNGVEAYRFRDAGSSEVVFVALEGKPYPLKVTDDDGLSLEFVAYDKPLKLDPPAKDDVLAVVP
jgi:hypothetical protein